MLGPLNDFWQYQVDNYKWVELQTLNPPSPRSKFAYTRYDDGVHEYFAVYGGAKTDGEGNHLYM